MRAASIADRRQLVQLLEAVRHGGELFLVFEFIDSSLQHCIQAATRRMEESQANRLEMANGSYSGYRINIYIYVCVNRSRVVLHVAVYMYDVRVSP